MKILDIIIFIPLLPFLLIYLLYEMIPWEKWLERVSVKLPRNIIELALGSYAIYASFAIWHLWGFEWYVPLLCMVGIALLIIAFRMD